MVRTRFAPSPTGYLHIGGVRTALYNWLYARQHGGQFILRVDDTDQRRNIDATLPPILEGFRWLGIDWDEGPDVDGPHAPYYQSQRAERYQQAVDQLLESSAAYWDFARPEEINQQREAAGAEGRTFVYDRAWAADSPEQAEAWRGEGRQGVVRLKMPREGACQFTDLVVGPYESQWENEQDHVIQRADGSFIYHLASVVDDRDFEITHVIRGIEHLSNTPRQAFIAQRLGCELPQYAHLPYVAEPGSKRKLSKRKIKEYLKNPDFKKLYGVGEEVARKINLEVSPETFNPVLVEFYSQVGFLPETLNNYLLLLGWSLDDKTEEFTREEMIRDFSLERVNQAPASFDPAKLMAFQDRQFQQVDAKKKVALAVPFLQRAGWIATPPECDTAPRVSRILEAAGDRVKIAGDILNYPEFFVGDQQLEYDPKAVKKRLGPEESRQLLAEFHDELAAAGEFTAEPLELLLKSFVERKEVKIGQIIHALRVAVTGKAVGIGMFDTLELIGQPGCLARIDRALSLPVGA